jgi:Ca-activated chloride channel family protein
MALTNIAPGYLLLQPGWLWLIPPVLLFMILSPWLAKQGWISKPVEALPATSVRHPQAMAYQSHRSSNKARSYFFTERLLVTMGGCLMLLALAQPVRLETPVATPVTSADLMLIIDTSISMVLKDYQLDGKRVDRMTMTRILLDRFSRHFSGKRIGIVVLGEQPQILLQPSADKNLVSYMINQLRITVSGRQAALGDAVAVAADYISSSKVTEKTVLVLISSADSPSGKLSPIAGVKRAIANGAILDTIAIGSTNMPPSKFAGLIYEPVDLKLLHQMAQMTGGKSYHAIDAASMDAALRSIEQRHQIKPGIKFKPRLRQPLYYWPLLMALLLFMVSTLLRYRSDTKSIHGSSAP